MAWIHLRTNDINHQMLSSQKEVADQMINNSLQWEGFIFYKFSKKKLRISYFRYCL